ncbi:hypothetical protein ACFX2I_025085 [Malus domestica]
MSKRTSGAKSGLASERLVIMKSRKVDYAAKVSLGPVLPSAVIVSAEIRKYAHTGSCERSTKFEAGKFPEVCALLKADLLEDINACAKFVDSVEKVVIQSNSFAKRPNYSMRSSQIATMHKTLILAAESMHVD